MQSSLNKLKGSMRNIGCIAIFTYDMSVIWSHICGDYAACCLAEIARLEWHLRKELDFKFRKCKQFSVEEVEHGNNSSIIRKHLSEEKEKHKCKLAINSS